MALRRGGGGVCGAHPAPLPELAARPLGGAAAAAAAGAARSAMAAAGRLPALLLLALLLGGTAGPGAWAARSRGSEKQNSFRRAASGLYQGVSGLFGEDNVRALQKVRRRPLPPPPPHAKPPLPALPRRCRRQAAGGGGRQSPAVGRSVPARPRPGAWRWTGGGLFSWASPAAGEAGGRLERCFGEKTAGEA